MNSIITLQDFFNKDTLNIFTDASIQKYPDETVGCAGAFVVGGEDFQNADIIESARVIVRNTTNNNSEATGVLLGVQKAIEYRDGFKTINLISDSKITIFGIRDWIFDQIVRTGNRPALIGSSGKEVANQNILLQIINTILYYDLRINLYHQNGHININKYTDVQEAYKTFKTSNTILQDIDIELIRAISWCNDVVDNFTREEVINFNHNSTKYIYENLVEFGYSQFNVNKYKQLIGKGEKGK